MASITETAERIAEQVHARVPQKPKHGPVIGIRTESVTRISLEEAKKARLSIDESRASDLGAAVIDLLGKRLHVEETRMGNFYSAVQATK